ncbi:MAG: SIMPL domain-containing protein [Syntrophobacterales bacterium]|nr:SIMPL domain-containing protein [Syntrophobacterales bacterium]
MILTVCLLTCLIAGGARAADKTAPEPATVEVEAEGEVFAKPDQAALFFHLETEAATAQEAAAANARLSEGFLKALKALLGPEESLKTLTYHIFPVYQQVERGQGQKKVQTQEVQGYRARHVFEVKVKDLGRLGKLLDTGVEHGATRVRGPFFEHSRLEELQQQAAAKALTKARNLADALARAGGLKVRRLKQLSTLSLPQPLRAAGAEMRMLAAPAPETPVEVGEESIRARVRAVFELTP